MDTFNNWIVCGVTNIELCMGIQWWAVNRQSPLLQGSTCMIFVEAANYYQYRLTNPKSIHWSIQTSNIGWGFWERQLRNMYYCYCYYFKSHGCCVFRLLLECRKYPEYWHENIFSKKKMFISVMEAYLCQMALYSNMIESKRTCC